MDYFFAGLEKEYDVVVSKEMGKELHDKYSSVFSGIWYFKGTFSIQVKSGVKPYQAHQGICIARNI